MAALTIEQIRAMFAEEAETRLAHLGQLLLQLEQSRTDLELIGSVFREVHTLKGSAAVAGLDDVSHLAHELEELVEPLRTESSPVTPDIIDTLLAGADGLASAIATARTSPADIDSEMPSPGAGERRTTSTAAFEHPEAHDLSATATQALAGVRSEGDSQASGDAPPHAGTGKALRRTPTQADGVVMVPMHRLDELVRLVGESASAHLRVGKMLNDRFGIDASVCAEFNDLSRSLNELQDRAMRTRMVPVSTITDQLHRAVRDLARSQGKEIRWEVRGGDTELDRGVLHRLSDSLLHLIRNAVDHGIEAPAQRAASGKPAQAIIRLHAMQLGSEVIIAVTDDGRGIDVERVRRQAALHGISADSSDEEEALQLIFQPGLSTADFVTDISGRGIGLDVVRARVEAARGRVEVRSRLGAGTEFRIVVPITLAVLRCLLVEAGGQRFALPFHRVVRSQAADPSVRQHADGRPIVLVDDQPVPVSSLPETLGLPSSSTAEDLVVVLADTAHRHAFSVDRLAGQGDVVLKGLSSQLPHLPAIAGASVEPDGSILVVLDPPGLIQRARARTRADAMPQVEQPAAGAPRRILVVDDALTVRELQRGILERAGFSVRVAIDGRQALAMLAEEPSDLVLTDVEMPNVDGFALTEAIRAQPVLANLPILILTSRSSEADRQRGLEAGADGYIVKSGFDEAALLSAIARLLGAPR